MASNNRIERINSAIKKEISNIIFNKINDPRIDGFISVASVKTTSDLEYSKIYLSIYNENKDKTISILNDASGFIRKNLAKNLKLRYVPKLTFVIDNGVEYSEKISQIINTIEQKENESR